MAKETVRFTKVRADIMQALVNYLGTLPYNDVAAFIPHLVGQPIIVELVGEDDPPIAPPADAPKDDAK